MLGLQLQGSGDIKRREVVLGPQLQGSGDIKRREVVLGPQLQGSGDIKRREVVLGPQHAGSRRHQEEGGGAGPSACRVQATSRGGRWCWTLKLAQWSWAVKVGPFLLQIVTQQRCNGHCPCDSALAQQLKQRLRSTLVAAQWRGDTALTLPLFWRRSTAYSVFRVGARARVFTSRPPHPSSSLCLRP